MTRRAARVDRNQAEIVRAFRTLGCDVILTHTLGEGRPDCFAAVPGYGVWVEIKDGSKPPSAQKLTPDELRFHQSFRGPLTVVRSVDDVVSLVADMKAKARRLVA